MAKKGKAKKKPMSIDDLVKTVAGLDEWATDMSTANQMWTKRLQEWAEDSNREGKPKGKRSKRILGGTKPPPPPPTYP